MIGEKIIKIMEEIEPIYKTEVSEDNKYKTPKLDEIVEMVRKLLCKNKVAIYPIKVEHLQSQGTKVNLIMKYRVIDIEDRANEYIDIEIPGSGYDDLGGKCVFSALSGAYRYLLQQVFAIPIRDEVSNNDNIKNETNTGMDNNIVNENDNSIENLSVENIDALFGI